MKIPPRLARTIFKIAFLAITLAACNLSSSTPTSTPAATATNPPAPTPTTPPFPPTFVEIARLGVGRTGPPDISPSGDRIALPTAIGILIYSTETLELISTLDFREDLIINVAWSPTGEYLVAAGYYGRIYVWNLTEWKMVKSFQAYEGTGHHGIGTVRLSWSSEGDKLAINASNSLDQVWDAQSWEPLFEFFAPVGALALPNVIWTQNNQSLLVPRYWDGVISIWEEPENNRLMSINSNLLGGESLFAGPAVVEISPNGSSVGFVIEANSFRIWDIQSGQEIRTINSLSNQPITGISWSPDSSRIAASYLNKSVSIFDVNTGKQISLFEEYSSSISGIKWFPDGERILIFSSEGAPMIWDNGNATELPLVGGHSDFIRSLGWSPDDSKIGSSSADEKIFLWDLPSGETIKNINSSEFDYYWWSPDLSQYITKVINEPYEHWDAETGELIGILDVVPFGDFFWSRNGNSLAWLGEEDELHIWARETQARSVVSDKSFSSSLELSIDGGRLALTKDDFIQVSDLSAKLNLTYYPYDTGAISFLALSPYGNLLAISPYSPRNLGDPPDTDLLIINVNTQQIVAILEGQVLENSLAWSLDGKLLITINQYGHIEIWDTTTWQVAQTIVTNSAGISALAWSHSGTMIAIGGSDGVVRIWGVQEE